MISMVACSQIRSFWSFLLLMGKEKMNLRLGTFSCNTIPKRIPGKIHSRTSCLSMKIFVLLLFWFCFVSELMASMAQDTISANQTLRDGETIVSNGGSFEMGFFPEGNSGMRYFGIWYYSVSRGRVAWVANIQIPLNDSSGVVKFDAVGNLLLLSQNTTVIWSSNTSTKAPQNPVAQLLDTGNLVIRNGNDQNPLNFLWQSFYHPRNTILPGMKIGHLGPGLDTRLTSWKSSDDPSLGSYTFEISPNGLEMIIKLNGVLASRSGPWLGSIFSGAPYLKLDPIYNYSYIHNEKESYFTYYLPNSSVVTTIILNEVGVCQRYTWIDRTNGWSLYSQSPADNCDNYALCGAYASCTIGNSPICGCLNRFEPTNQREWDSADWSSGCVRITPLDCQRGDGFIKYSHLKLPYTLNTTVNGSMTLEECRIACLKNCSCMGYANSEISSPGNGTGCILWFSELIDMKQYTVDGQDLYVRMAASEAANAGVGAKSSGSSKGKRRIKIVVGLLSAVIFLLGVVLVMYILKKKKKQEESRRMLGNLQRGSVRKSREEDLELPLFDLDSIVNATHNFSTANKLGEGGFGPVYKGILEDGQEIAVKRLSKDSRQGIEEFKNEVIHIVKLQHRNLVKLHGCCIDAEEKMLIYEFMPNKSLDFFIFDNEQRQQLDWPRRYNIINGIARGLLYLHQDSRLRIIHRDLKASNVLLDFEMNPKISDFGLARSFGGNEIEVNTNKVVGTYGYISPEYAIDGIYSVKSDVFSFGVLVLEIVSGRRNRGFSHPGHQLNLLGHAWTLFTEGKPSELFSEDIIETCDSSEVLRSIHVGLLCVQHSPRDRPNMSTVVLMLGSEAPLPPPKQPGFFTERDLIDLANSSSSQNRPCTDDQYTITLLEPR